MNDLHRCTAKVTRSPCAGRIFTVHLSAAMWARSDWCDWRNGRLRESRASSGRTWTGPTRISLFNLLHSSMARWPGLSTLLSTCDANSWSCEAWPACTRTLASDSLSYLDLQCITYLRHGDKTRITYAGRWRPVQRGDGRYNGSRLIETNEKTLMRSAVTPSSNWVGDS